MKKIPPAEADEPKQDQGLAEPPLPANALPDAGKDARPPASTAPVPPPKADSDAVPDIPVLPPIKPAALPAKVPPATPLPRSLPEKAKFKPEPAHQPPEPIPEPPQTVPAPKAKAKEPPVKKSAAPAVPPAKAPSTGALSAPPPPSGAPAASTMPSQRSLAILAGVLLLLAAPIAVFMISRSKNEPDAAAPSKEMRPFEPLPILSGGGLSPGAPKAPPTDIVPLPAPEPTPPPPLRVPPPVAAPKPQSREIPSPAPAVNPGGKPSRPASENALPAKTAAPDSSPEPRPQKKAPSKTAQWIFEGRVYDLVNLQPVYGAVLAFKDGSGAEAGRTNTGDGGRYRVAIKAPSEGASYQLAVSHPDYAERYLDEISPPFAEMDRPQRLELARIVATHHERWMGDPARAVTRDFVMVPKILPER